MTTARDGIPPKTPRRPPASSPEARQNELIYLATELVEKRLRDGSASAQETVHYLKLADPARVLEVERKRFENELLQARTEAIQAAAHSEQVAMDAIRAMRIYQGVDEPGQQDHYA